MFIRGNPRVSVAVQPLRPSSTGREVRLEDYTAYLARSPLASASRVAYARRVGAFLVWLRDQPEHCDRALGDPLAREHAVRDYLRHLRVDLHW